MKRAGGLFERVLAYENLRLAFWRASRGKRERDETRAYRQRLDAELVRLRDGLADGSYPVGNYRTFVVYEPKERLICAAPFCERVLHHALMNVCAPLFERWLVADTFACRPGLGQTAALVRGEMLVRRYDWYLKCDIRKYFYSISHDVVAAILRRKFKDRRIVFWFLKILSTYEASPGRGLPIGNLTSQYLANLYLDPLDRARATWGMPCGYARYMDDFVFWSDSKETLRAIQRRLPGFLRDTLRLELKCAPALNRTAMGMDFLGLRLTKGGIRASRHALRRYRARVRALEGWHRRGLLGEDELAASVTSMTAFLRLADTAAWRRSRLVTETGEWPLGRLACNGAGAGTTTPATAALPDATTTRPPTATTTSASGSPCRPAPQYCHPARRPVDSPSPFSVSGC